MPEGQGKPHIDMGAVIRRRIALYESEAAQHRRAAIANEGAAQALRKLTEWAQQARKQDAGQDTDRARLDDTIPR